jgi:hypothetical protein
MSSLRSQNRTMTAPSPNRLGVPPPVKLDLIDSGRVVGWITGNVVGFRGFGDEVEAAHAAWVAYRTLARRLARRDGRRPPPVDTEPLALQRRGDQEVILVGRKAIGTLVRPGAESPSGPDSFGFEISIPPPADELRVRGMAHLIYRTLRKSGVRWALWRPGVESVTRRPQEPSRQAHNVAQAGEYSEADVQSAPGDGADRANNQNGGESDVTPRHRQRAWWLPALPWRRARRLDRRPGNRV